MSGASQVFLDTRIDNLCFGAEAWIPRIMKTVTDFKN